MASRARKSVLSKPATHTCVERYAQLHTIGVTQPVPGGDSIDGISVLSFASANEVEGYLITSDQVNIAESEQKLAWKILGSGRPLTRNGSLAGTAYIDRDCIGL